MTTSFFDTTVTPTHKPDFSGSIELAIADLPEGVSLKETVTDWFRHRLDLLSNVRAPTGQLTDLLFLLCVELLAFYAEHIATIIAGQPTRDVQTLNPSKAAKLQATMALLPVVKHALDTLWEASDHFAKGDANSKTLSQIQLLGADLYWKRGVHETGSQLIMHFGNFVLELTPILEPAEIKEWNPRREMARVRPTSDFGR